VKSEKKTIAITGKILVCKHSTILVE